MHRALLLLASLASAAAVSIEWYADETTWPSCSVPVSFNTDRGEDRGRVVAFHGSQGETLSVTPLHGDAVTSIRVLDDNEVEEGYGEFPFLFYLSGFADCPENDVADVVVNVVDAASTGTVVAGPYTTSVGPNPTADAVIDTFSLEYHSSVTSLYGDSECGMGTNMLTLATAPNGTVAYNYTFNECASDDASTVKTSSSGVLTAEELADAPWKAEGKERALASLASAKGPVGLSSVYADDCFACYTSAITFSATWTDAAFPATLASQDSACSCAYEGLYSFSSPSGVLSLLVYEIYTWIKAKTGNGAKEEDEEDEEEEEEEGSSSTSSASNLLLSPVLLAIAAVAAAST